MKDPQSVEDLLRQTYRVVADLPGSGRPGSGRPGSGLSGSYLPSPEVGPVVLPGGTPAPRVGRRRQGVFITVGVLVAASVGLGAVLVGTRSAVPVRAASSSKHAKTHTGGSTGHSSTGPASVANANSTCAPTTDPSSSGGAPGTLTSTGTQVASGTVGGQSWTLWSAAGQSGATGIEDGGLVLDGRAYGLCPGYPNPAELELIDAGSTGVVAGVVGYPGLAKVDLSESTAGTFDVGASLPAPSVQVVNGVSFFIGTLPQSACDYSSLEVNTTSPGVSAQHNLGFGSCVADQLVPISESQGIWQLPPGQFQTNFANTASGSPSAPGSGAGAGSVSVPNDTSTCAPTTGPSSSGGAAGTLTSTDTEVASGTVGGQSWTLWSASGQSGATGIEDGGLVLDGRAYGLCPGYPNPAELELIDAGSTGVVAGVVGYPGLAKVDLSESTAGTFDVGASLPAPSVQVVNGVSFFIGTLPQSACDYSSLEVNTTSPGVSAQHNLGFGSCVADQLVPISESQGIWQLPPGQFPSSFG